MGWEAHWKNAEDKLKKCTDDLAEARKKLKKEIDDLEKRVADLESG